MKSKLERRGHGSSGPRSLASIKGALVSSRSGTPSASVDATRSASVASGGKRKRSGAFSIAVVVLVLIIAGIVLLVLVGSAEPRRGVPSATRSRPKTPPAKRTTRAEAPRPAALPAARPAVAMPTKVAAPPRSATAAAAVSSNNWLHAPLPETIGALSDAIAAIDRDISTAADTTAPFFDTSSRMRTWLAATEEAEQLRRKRPQQRRGRRDAVLVNEAAREMITVGFCNDGLQQFARDVAPHIVPWRGVKLIFTPDVGTKIDFRGTLDTRFINAITSDTSSVVDEGGEIDAKGGTKPIDVPDILICGGWNYVAHLKKSRDAVAASSDAAARTERIASSRSLFSTLGSAPPNAGVMGAAALAMGGSTHGSWLHGVWIPRLAGEEGGGAARLPRHRRGERPFIIGFSDESHNTGGQGLDMLLDTKSDPSHLSHILPTVFAPAALTNWWRVLHASIDMRAMAQPGHMGALEARAVLAHKTRWAAFMYNVCWRPNFYFNDAILRVLLFDVLTEVAVRTYFFVVELDSLLLTYYFELTAFRYV